MCPPSTLAQQMGLAGSCQEGTGSSAAGLRLPFAACRTCGPSRRRQSALPLYAPTTQSGHRLACMWARKRGDPVESRAYLPIFKNLLQNDALRLGLPGPSLLPAALQAKLFVGESGTRERCCRKPSYPSGARSESTIFSLAGDGESAPTGFDGTNQHHCLYPRL